MINKIEKISSIPMMLGYMESKKQKNETVLKNSFNRDSKNEFQKILEIEKNKLR